MISISKGLTAGLTLSFGFLGPPVMAQEQNPDLMVKTESPLMRDFILSAPKPDISLSLTRELKEDRQDVTLRIGERPLNNFERQSALTQDMGDMGEAKLKFMKIEWRLRFGGPR